MLSLVQFKNASCEKQSEEIRHLCAKLELTYNAYEETGIILFRGQMWKFEKYLILYLYLSK